MEHSREHDSKGTIQGYIPAKDNGSQATCTLLLTDIPQYSVVELVINKYVLPTPCFCRQDGISSCNYITVTISNDKNRFCSPTPDPVYTYKSDSTDIKIVSTRYQTNFTVDFSLTYRGKCYTYLLDKYKLMRLT